MVVSPQVFLDHLTGDQPVWMAHQVLEQSKLFGRQFDGLSGALHGVGGGVHLQVGGHQQRGFAVRFASQQGAHPGAQFIHLEGFDQVIVCAAIQTADAVFERVTRRQHQDRGIDALVAQGLAYTQTVFLRQHDVEDDDVVGRHHCQFFAFQPVIGHVDDVTVVLQGHAQRVA